MGNRIRTDTVFLPLDFKSKAAACYAIPTRCGFWCEPHKHIQSFCIVYILYHKIFICQYLFAIVYILFTFVNFLPSLIMFLAPLAALFITSEATTFRELNILAIVIHIIIYFRSIKTALSVDLINS